MPPPNIPRKTGVLLVLINSCFTLYTVLPFVWRIKTFLHFSPLAVKLYLKTGKSLLYHVLSDSYRMHKICFRPELCAGRFWEQELTMLPYTIY